MLDRMVAAVVVVQWMLSRSVRNLKDGIGGMVRSQWLMKALFMRVMVRIFEGVSVAEKLMMLKYMFECGKADAAALVRCITMGRIS